MFEISRHPLTVRGVKKRVVKLSIVASPILGAYFFNLTHLSSPLACPVLAFTGIPCPGCGMTRSFLAIARGDFSAAVSYHLFGPLLFTIALLLAMHLSLELALSRRIAMPSLVKFLREKQVLTLLGLGVFIYHVCRLHNLSQAGILSVNFHQSSLYQLLISP